MSTNTPKAKKGTQRRPNKAQRRASQVRAAQTVAQPPVVSRRDTEDPASATATTRTTVRERTTPRPRMRPANAPSRVVARPVGLTRDQEYAAIKGDLVRLLLTFGVLMILMLVLLFIIEG